MFRGVPHKAEPPIRQVNFDKKAKMFNTPEIDKDEIALSKEVGLRMLEARKEFCKLSQKQAADMLGITSDQLRAMEEGLLLVPLSVIKKAAEIFDVSAEWLLSITDDWEFCEETRERDFLAGMERLQLENHAKTVAKQLSQDNKITALADALALLGPAIQAIDDGFTHFWMANPEFENMPRSAVILNRIDQAQALARSATLSLVRVKALAIDSLAALPQPKPAIRVWTNPAFPQPVLTPITECKPRASRKRSNTTLAAVAS
ncbi:hypothetical protein CWO84_14760 [Methylomonas sp. Kb3]|nr:hypothetical protein CWO84_14760 [Methylomonas sp. Kb3]